MNPWYVGHKRVYTNDEGKTVLVLAEGTARECHHTLRPVRKPPITHDFLYQTWGDGTVERLEVFTKDQTYQIGKDLFVSESSYFSKGYYR